jgi:signal transduction histidine kinase
VSQRGPGWLSRHRTLRREEGWLAHALASQRAVGLVTDRHQGGRRGYDLGNEIPGPELDDRDDTSETFVARDTGVGIAPEDQEAVFEEFRQVGTADKKVEGTGLGLALSRKFIELHGGRIWVKSQVGQGSTFTFTVPARRAE